MVPSKLIGNNSAVFFLNLSLSENNHLILKMSVPTKTSNVKLVYKIISSKFFQNGAVPLLDLRSESDNYSGI